jgi:hypothetical protein
MRRVVARSRWLTPARVDRQNGGREAIVPAGVQRRVHRWG